MKDNWIELDNPDDVESFGVEFWNSHSKSIRDGSFWADEIKNLKSQPRKRLEMAVRNFPLPAAFREAAIAMRSIIRTLRKEGNDYEQALTVLYGFAAIDSFSIPYSERLGEPGYNIMESIPGTEIRKLKFIYQELGYKELKILNKTDIKWIVESWGEPRSHTTLNEMHLGVWTHYENILIARRRDEEATLFRKLRQ